MPVGIDAPMPAVAEPATRLNGALFSLLRLKRKDIGILPLAVTVPFMFLPKLIDGYTQPWVILCGIIALFSFRTERFLHRQDISLIVLSLCCVLIFLFRNTVGAVAAIRMAHTLICFIVLWTVARRADSAIIGDIFRFSITIWFLFGLYEYINMNLGPGLGVPRFLAGQYLAGRSGVPGLGAEPSYYGSLSVVQAMYLISENDRRNFSFIVMAFASLFFSGSMLAALLIIFPLFKLPARTRIVILIIVPLAIFAMSMLSLKIGLLSRLSGYNNVSSQLGLFLDPSLNTRAGHIIYTLYIHFWQSVFYMTPPDFLSEYNAYARGSGYLMYNFSNYITPAAGELIYNCGLAGLLLLLNFLYLVARKGTLRTGEKVGQICFIIVCMLNPITLANPFLVFYAAKAGLKPLEEEAARRREGTIGQ